MLGVILVTAFSHPLLSQLLYDSPYRDAAASPPATSRDTARPVRRQAPAVTAPGVAFPSVGARMRPPTAAPHRSRSGRRRRAGKSTTQPSTLTSHPTSRTAYVETRAWLLAQHGPVCAYCGSRFTASVMTLDHVAPRRGQTAYDRRDNLVLACPGCNTAKRDQAPLAFLLGSRSPGHQLGALRRAPQSNVGRSRAVVGAGRGARIGRRRRIALSRLIGRDHHASAAMVSSSSHRAIVLLA